MSGALDKKMRALAVKLLKKFGQEGTVVRAGAKSYDDDTGETIVTAGESIPIDFYIDKDKTDTYRQTNLIERNESIALIAAKQVDIKEQDFLKGASIYTTIIRFESVWSGAKVAYYEAVIVV